MGRPLEHGESRSTGKTAEYRIWCGIKQRCTNPRCTGYAYYGGRGVKMCSAWLRSYQPFLQDMGRRPSVKHTMDRIDPNGNYCKENCRWATRQEQQHNTRRETKSSKHPGVYWHKKGKAWIARMPADATGRREYLGCFPKEKDAAAAITQKTEKIGDK